MRQHNEKRAAAISESERAEESKNEHEDDSYEVTLDDDFLTALEYGMPPASGMVIILLGLHFSFQGLCERKGMFSIEKYAITTSFKFSENMINIEFGFHCRKLFLTINILLDPELSTHIAHFKMKSYVAFSCLLILLEAFSEVTSGTKKYVQFFLMLPC